MSKYLRFKDLVERGVVNNRVTLGRWIKFHNFPPGVLLGPNTRVWTEDEIAAYYKARAAEREAVDAMAS